MMQGPNHSNAIIEPLPLPGQGARCPECSKGIMLTKWARFRKISDNVRMLTCRMYPACRHEEHPEPGDGVTASILSDDGLRRVDFDAVAFLRDAHANRVQALAACGWGGDYDADEVSYTLREFPGYSHVQQIIQKCQQDDIGFETYINGKEAMVWLKCCRPDLHTIILAAGG